MSPMEGIYVTRRLAQLTLVLLLASCSTSVDVDAITALPGSWTCDDGIVVTFNDNGRYEWRVPPYDDIDYYIEDSDHIKMNDDGGHTIFDTWRVDSNTLHMDMLGETDRYTLTFKSETSFRMSGPDTFSCQRN